MTVPDMADVGSNNILAYAANTCITCICTVYTFEERSYLIRVHVLPIALYLVVHVGQRFKHQTSSESIWDACLSISQNLRYSVIIISLRTQPREKIQ